MISALLLAAAMPAPLGLFDFPGSSPESVRVRIARAHGRGIRSHMEIIGSKAPFRKHARYVATLDGGRQIDSADCPAISNLMQTLSVPIDAAAKKPQNGVIVADGPSYSIEITTTFPPNIRNTPIVTSASGQGRSWWVDRAFDEAALCATVTIPPLER